MGVELAAQVADVDVDDVRRALVVPCPHLGEQLGPGHDAAGVASAGTRGRRTPVRSARPLPPPRYDAARRVDLQVADRAQARGRHGRPAAGGQRAQPRHQLAEVERLDQVVVGASVEAADAVTDVRRGRSASAPETNAPACAAPRRP